MNEMDDDLLALLLDEDEADLEGEGDGGIGVRAMPGVPAPLSYGQHQLWLLQQLDPDLTSYNMVRAFEVDGELDADALESSLRSLIARHAVLRTRFAQQDGEPVQIVQGDAVFNLVYEMLDDSAQLADKLRQAANHVFDLGTAPLLFARLYRCAPRRHVLALGMHHIVSDGWSNALLMQDIAQGYRQALSGVRTPNPAARIGYADYAIWQREGMPGAELPAQLDYWERYLSDVPALALPDAPARGVSAAGPTGARRRFRAPAGLEVALQAFCRSEGCTLFVACLAAWQVLLGRLDGQRDFAIGVPNAGRGRAELQNVVGFFVTMQVYRARLRPELSWSALCRQVRGDALAAMGRADTPLELLLERRVGAARQPGRHPLFQVMFGLEMQADERGLELGGLDVKALPLDPVGSKAELSLDIVAGDGQLQGILEYDTRLFDDESAAALEAGYLQLLRAMVAAPAAPIGEAGLAGPEQLALLRRLGDHPGPDGRADPVTRRFERQARATPDADALVFEGHSLSYAEVNRRVNQLAHYLIAQGAGAETRVGIALPRSVELVIGVLAILKSGAAYVALDPDYPRERLASMVEDSAIALMLTTSALAPVLPAAARKLAIDTLALEGHSADDPEPLVRESQLAYVIYTSGSTGRPKGIGVEHHALSAHTQVAIGYFGLSPRDRVLLFSTINFDGFVEQLFPPLCMGAAVVVRGPELWDSGRFYREIMEQRISVADLSTAYWFLLAQDFAAHGPRDYGALRQVHATGEAMPPEGMRAWADAGLAGVNLLNSYGPTETIVTASVYDCHACVVDGEPLPAATPIGRPLAGRSFHVLDADLNPVAPGAVGELCIGGALLARGYLNRPGLSAEKFIADPHGAPGARLYRTGDLVRWRADGQLLYLGRIDQQVKVRGFRIELGEVESQLLRQPGVREAAVIADAGQLLAYVTANPCHGGALDEAQLRRELASALPEYVVPARIVTLAALPLSPAGKVDRKALPRPQGAPVAGREAPCGPAETALAAIWCELLRIDEVGRNDDFFALGGNSLMALRLLRQVQQRFGEGSLALADVFNTPTLAGQALRLDMHETPCCEVVHMNRDGAGMPLYCFPGLNVNSSEYAALVEALGQDRPVRSFVCHALTGARWDGLELDQLARRYAAHIRAETGGQPCALLGWSFGGDLAFATARELERDQAPALVCVVDVFEGAAPAGRSLTVEESAAAELKLARWLERSAMAGRWDALFARMTAEERNAALCHLLDEAELPLDGPALGSGEYSLWVAFDNAMIMGRYRYGTLGAPLHAFMAGASLERRAPGLRDWSVHATSFSHSVVEGVDHRAILLAPAFQQEVKRRLLQVDA